MSVFDVLFDAVIGVLPPRIAWALAAAMVLFLVVFFAFLYSQGRLTW